MCTGCEIKKVYNINEGKTIKSQTQKGQNNNIKKENGKKESQKESCLQAEEENS